MNAWPWRGTVAAFMALVLSGCGPSDSSTPVHQNPLRAFRDDASPAEWRRLEREAHRFARLTTEHDFDYVRTLLHQLGSRWTPPSREALIALLMSGKSE
jgi:hypothetical protein